MKKLIILLFAAFSLLACEYETITPRKVELPDTGGDPISFSKQIEPFFVAKCASCHAGVTPILTEGKVYNSLVGGGYVNTATPDQSSVYVKVKDGTHPGGSNNLTATELALLLKWIEEGVQNN